MAQRGLCSRREADAFIVQGLVRVNGRACVLGERVHPQVAITLDPRAQAAQSRQVTILLNKPLGYVSGQPEPGCLPAVCLIRPETRSLGDRSPPFSTSMLRGLAPAGRLDIDSTGLLVLTQDGRIARQLIGEQSNIDKEYHVRIQGKLSDEGLALLNHGLSLDGKALRPAQVSRRDHDPERLCFVLREGRKRQIRRMCELVGVEVIALRRIRIGRIRLGNLRPGQWRLLDSSETF